MKIYTKRGDAGETDLIGGERVPKDSVRIDACGTVDELNAHLGLVCAEMSPERHEPLFEPLHRVQSRLFDIGAALATPNGGRAFVAPIDERAIAELEEVIDALQTELPPLQVFILPGGTRLAALLHVARTVCRRAERQIVPLVREHAVDPLLLVYLNRLSDLLFVMARTANHLDGHAETEWRPSRPR